MRHAWRVGAVCGVCAVWARSQKLVRRVWRVGAEPETGRELVRRAWRVGAACGVCGVGAEPGRSGRETRAACVAGGRVGCGRKRSAVWRGRDETGAAAGSSGNPGDWAVRRVREQVAVRSVAVASGAYNNGRALKVVGGDRAWRACEACALRKVDGDRAWRAREAYGWAREASTGGCEARAVWSREVQDG